MRSDEHAKKNTFRISLRHCVRPLCIMVSSEACVLPTRRTDRLRGGLRNTHASARLFKWLAEPFLGDGDHDMNGSDVGNVDNFSGRRRSACGRGKTEAFSRHVDSRHSETVPFQSTIASLELVRATSCSLSLSLGGPLPCWYEAVF